ncbi:glycine receptor subunit alpha-3-like [Liolophura sinensis]|uniref:glycine receptor subunit alpha-3-like n=1 Tax=Liolophura sinensis TaxID=3198878 RepID=UPI0031592A08
MWGAATVLILLAIVRCRGSNDTGELPSRRFLVKHILADYDPNVAPGDLEMKPTEVGVQMYLRHLDSFNEVTMDFDVTLFLRLIWLDPRLNYGNYSHIPEPLELNVNVMDSLWVPDLFFANEKTAMVHDVTVPNRLMHVYRNGTVRYSVRLSMKLGCEMSLQYYPFDSQICPVEAESYGHTTDSVLFSWYGDSPFVTPDDTLVAQFHLLKVETIDCTKGYGTADEFTCLRSNIYLERDHGYFILQVYIPSALIVLLSWVSFFLNVDAVPARISLGVLTVLTLTTQSSTLQASLPQVSYVKALDAWLATCLCFVFAALLEFAAVNVLSRQNKSESTASLKQVSCDKHSQTYT